MRKSWLLGICVLLLSIQFAEAQKKVNRKDPVAVVNALFKAAKTNNPKLLKKLCPPDQSNDGDTDCICALYSRYKAHKCDKGKKVTENGDSKDEVNWELFVDYFRNGVTLEKEVKIEGDRAIIPFLFGPNGDLRETMQLIRIKKKWYLSSF